MPNSKSVESIKMNSGKMFSILVATICMLMFTPFSYGQTTQLKTNKSETTSTSIQAEPIIVAQTNSYEGLSFVAPIYLSRVKFLQNAFAQISVKDNLGTLRRKALTLRPTQRRLIPIRDLLVKDPQNRQGWINFAIANRQSKSNNYVEKRDFRRNAISASLIAWHLSQSDGEKAVALHHLAWAFRNSGSMRPMLEAYKLSLALQHDDAIEKTYLELHQAHGFRILNFSVDSDAASPRACIQFSEKLVERDVTYADYIRLNGKEVADLSASGTEICVGGLKHGENYRIQLRAGLPGDYQEKMPSQIELETYVRDRTPHARFTGNGYVLSRSHTKGIPIVSVNLDSIDLSILQVTDAAVGELLREGRFNRALTKRDLSRLEQESATEIWQGSLTIDQKLNTEVTTLLPVFEAIPELKPGAYVMVVNDDKDRNDYWASKPTQWFVVSDLGLSSLEADDGLHVFVRSLESTIVLSNVRLKLVAKSNEILGETTTDAKGHGIFAPGLLRGRGPNKAYAVIAETDAPDYTLLDLTKSGFDLTDRGVEGRNPPGPIDAFLYTERGIYRPGETIYATALLRDSRADSLDTLPLTFKLFRPDGVEYAVERSSEGQHGGHAGEFTLASNVARGSWDVRIYTNPDDAAIATKRVLVQDFVPERIDFDIALVEDKPLIIGQTVGAKVDAKYLFGAPAVGLNIVGNIAIFASQPTIGKYKGFHFGLSDEQFVQVNGQIATTKGTDDDGQLAFNIVVPSVPQTTLPLASRITATMLDSGGRSVTRTISASIQSDKPSIGIKPLFDGSAAQGSEAQFQIVGLNATGEAVAVENAVWHLTKILHTYQYYRDGDGNWRWQAITRTEAIDQGVVDLEQDQFARLGVDVEWGSYRLEIKSVGDHEAIASYDFYAGWYVEKSSFDAPDALQLGLDKEVYQVGDEIVVRLKSEQAGQLQLLVANEQLHEVLNGEVSKGENTFTLRINEKWGIGAYVVANLFTPMDATKGRLPTRSIGVAYAAIDQSSRTLGVEILAPLQMRPNRKITLPITVNNTHGQKTYVAVSAVDQGILNLTGYRPPKPQDHYYSKRKLGAVLRDIYGSLINGLDGVLGRLRVGGDAAVAGLNMQGNPPAEAPVALFSGIVALDGNGKGTVSFEVPQFNGTLKLMAVAWTGSALGSTSEDLTVRDPIVMTATMPRFMAPDDLSRLLVQFDNTDGPAGTYNFTVTSKNGFAQAIVPKDLEFELQQKGSLTRSFQLSAFQVGDERLTLAIEGPNGLLVTKELTLPIRANDPYVTLSKRHVVDANKDENLSALALAADGFAPFVAGTARLSLQIGNGDLINSASLITQLNNYPYRCAEQTTSRAMPLLGLPNRSNAQQETIAEAIESLISHQSSNGSFGYWGANSTSNLWLNSYISDFFTRARSAGHNVPDRAYDLAISNLKNELAFKSNIEKNADMMAYSLYVLAKNGQASLSDLRYFYDVNFEKFSTPLAKAQLAGALALTGETSRARAGFKAASAGFFIDRAKNIQHRGYYGGHIRDGSAIVTLMAESGIEELETNALLTVLGADYRKHKRLGTQELSWLIMASSASKTGEAAPDFNLSLSSSLLEPATFNPNDGSSGFEMAATELESNALTLTNLSPRRIFVQEDRTGILRNPIAEANSGFALERTYNYENGEPVDLENITQNAVIIVGLNIQQLTHRSDQLLLVDPLPAGFEMEGKGFINASPSGNAPTYSAQLEDRFVAALNGKTFEKLPVTDGSNVWQLAYRVRAVSPGDFVVPQAIIEDMYEAGLYGTTARQNIQIIGK